MTRSIVLNPGEPRSPRVFVAFAQPDAPVNQVYLKVQPDGGLIIYMASSIDRSLQQVFDYYAYNGFMTACGFTKMCVDNKLFPANKKTDPLQHIFKTTAKGERCIEYDSFLQLLHLLSRLKFRKANLPEQDAVAPCCVEKSCEAMPEIKEASVDCVPRLMDQVVQERPQTEEVGIMEKAELKDAGEQVELEGKSAEIQVDIRLSEENKIACCIEHSVSTANLFQSGASENLLSEINCALMFRDGDLMAVPIHPALHRLPPPLAREYFEQILSRRNAQEPTFEKKSHPPEKPSPKEPSAPAKEAPATQRKMDPRINYREFKVLVFMASQWICQTQNSYWAFVKVVRDTLLPALFRSDPWKRQDSSELKNMRRKKEGSTASSGSDTEEEEQRSTSHTTSSTEESLSSRSSSSGEWSGLGQKRPSRHLRRISAAARDRDLHSKEAYGGYDDEQPIGAGSVFYEGSVEDTPAQSEGSRSDYSMEPEEDRGERRTVTGPPHPPCSPPLDNFAAWCSSLAPSACDSPVAGGGGFMRPEMPHPLRPTLETFGLPAAGSHRRDAQGTALSFGIPMPPSFPPAP
ncbi:hypothetical protein cyc_08285 [Cyclospora cayetanensis]|uniref:Uncharacterized protein n=1 Tax=Cyclospora cayetanensis TaxID=88456 RepID=A0A1D3CVF7_9EIME|nr:hypothetical protein cyc_08285 [Cyclospora cayetanensis]